MRARLAGIAESSPAGVVWWGIPHFDVVVAAVEVRAERWQVEYLATVSAVPAELCVVIALPARRVHPVVVFLAAWEHSASPAGRTSRGWSNRDFAFLFRVHDRFHLRAVPALVSLAGEWKTHSPAWLVVTASIRLPSVQSPETRGCSSAGKGSPSRRMATPR
jgi:hypothetical protein